MLDDQLAASIKQIRQRFLAIRSVECVILLNPHPRQLAPLPVNHIAQSRQFLFSGQQSLARSQPFCLRYDSVAHTHRGHCCSPMISICHPDRSA